MGSVQIFIEKNAKNGNQIHVATADHDADGNVVPLNVSRCSAAIKT